MSNLTLQRKKGSGQIYRELFGIEMMIIPGGTFMMGSPENEPQRSEEEGPQHQVKLSSFIISRHQITQAQWQAVAAYPQINQELNPSPSRFEGENNPVEEVSWYEAVEFCNRLTQLTGRQYRLPTEAEWEYACRAGTTTPFHFGHTITPEVANYNGNYSYNESPTGEYRERTTPVGSFGVANAFGLFDMHGNVLEWCLDHYHSSYENKPSELKENGHIPWLSDDEKSRRMLRGGSWIYNPRYCRSAYRFHFDPGYRSLSIGFRVVCSAAWTLQ